MTNEGFSSKKSPDCFLTIWNPRRCCIPQLCHQPEKESAMMRNHRKVTTRRQELSNVSILMNIKIALSTRTSNSNHTLQITPNPLHKNTKEKWLPRSSYPLHPPVTTSPSSETPTSPTTTSPSPQTPASPTSPLAPPPSPLFSSSTAFPHLRTNSATLSPS